MAATSSTREVLTRLANLRDTRHPPRTRLDDVDPELLKTMRRADLIQPFGDGEWFIKPAGTRELSRG